MGREGIAYPLTELFSQSRKKRGAVMIRMSHTIEMKKGKNVYLWMVTCIFGFSLMAGCATTPKTLDSETSMKIKKIGIVTILKDKEPRVFDRTGASKHYHGGYVFGAIGGALEGLAIGIETAVLIRASLGGDPDILRRKLGQYPINEIVQENITTKLSERYQVVDAHQFLNALRVSKEGEELKIEDYLDVCKKCEADTMLKVDLLYGLAAYAREKSSAAIIAKLFVYDVGTKTLLMEKEVLSDKYLKRSRVIPDFAAGDAELYKRDVHDAVNVLSVIVARDFGLNIGMPQFDYMSPGKKGFYEFPEELSGIAVTCNKPYKIGQDCSIWSGAKRTIKIKERNIKVAGSDDGKIVLVMDKLFADEESMFSCFELVKEELLSNGIKIVRVIKLVTAGKVKGCILELDGDGYSILRNYSVD
jgi:hypothetical protein